MAPSFRPSSPQPRDLDPWDGLLLVDKPAGPTSHDIVDYVRRHLRVKKVGHGGTLDPNATGLLIILLGRGTRLSNQVMGGDKTYEGIMRLGIATDSQDIDGEIVSQQDASGVTREQLDAEFAKWRGDLMQMPPMVSAIKKNGVPLYKLARKGETVEREPRLIHIYSFELLDYTPPDVRFRVRCTKGTYVRTICADVGTALGVGAHLAELRRTQSGDFDVKGALPLKQILDMKPDDLIPHVLPLTSVRPAAAPPAP